MCVGARNARPSPWRRRRGRRTTPWRDLAESEDVVVVRGPLDDVLERYRLAAEALDAEAVVRVTGDCPLVDPRVIDDVVRRFRESSADYVSNVRPPTFPDGLDVEVISRAALDRSAREAALPSEREHVAVYIAEHPELFSSENVAHEPDLSGMRWTIDYPDDLEFVRAVFRRFPRTRGRVRDGGGGRRAGARPGSSRR